MNKTPKPTLTDRERILTEVIRGLASTQCLRPRAAGQWSSEPYKRDYGDNSYHVHFAPWLEKELKKGDLVIGKTGGIHEYTIGFYVAPLSSDLGGAVIREIGSERLCDYTNEMFEPIVGLTPIQLLEGERYQVYQKVLKAFRKGSEWSYRFSSVDFHDDSTLTIWVREAFGGRLGHKNVNSLPFAVKIPWSKKTNVKAILTAMREQGYGTRKFEYSAEQPVLQ